MQKSWLFRTRGAEGRDARRGDSTLIMGRKRCSHGKGKSDCAECNPCPHSKLKNICVECKGCPHGKLKNSCVECKGSPHGKLKRNCAECRKDSSKR